MGQNYDLLIQKTAEQDPDLAAGRALLGAQSSQSQYPHTERFLKMASEDTERGTITATPPDETTAWEEAKADLTGAFKRPELLIDLLFGVGPRYLGKKAAQATRPMYEASGMSKGAATGMAESTGAATEFATPLLPVGKIAKGVLGIARKAPEIVPVRKALPAAGETGPENLRLRGMGYEYPQRPLEPIPLGASEAPRAATPSVLETLSGGAKMPSPRSAESIPYPKNVAEVLTQGRSREVWNAPGNRPGFITPQTALTLGRTAAGGAAGWYSGDSTEESMYRAALGAAGAAALGPAYRGVKAGLASPGTMATKVAKAKLDTKLGPFAGFTMSDAVKGVPGAQQIVKEGWFEKDVEHVIENYFVKKLDTAYRQLAPKGWMKSIPEESVKRVHRFLDGDEVASKLTAFELKAAREVRGIFDEMGTAAGLPREQFLRDYFPHVREAAVVSQTLQIERANDVLPLFKQMKLPEEYRPFFMKKRSLSDPAIDYGMDPVKYYVYGVARKIALKGGVNPATGEQIPGFFNTVKNHFGVLPDELAPAMADYINTISGVTGPEVSKVASRFKQVEFLRTIAANAMSPINNLLQTTNTLAMTSSKSWGLAWFDLKNKAVIDEAVRAMVIDRKVGSDLSKVDLESLISGGKLDRALAQASHAGGWLFRASEQINRLHAFAAGLRDAKAAGLSGQAARDFARDLTFKTQFRFGVENLPPSMRGGSVLSQYKPYQINQALFLKDLVTDAAAGALRGDMSKAAPLAKWIVGITAIGGPSAMVGQDGARWINQQFSQLLMGDPDSIEFRGLAAAVGLNLAQQVGIGALPLENIRNFFFVLPGPFVNHVLDAMSATLGLRLNGQDLLAGRFGEPLGGPTGDPEERTRRLVTSLPFGIPANRLRTAAVASQSPNRPRTMEESFALEPATGRRVREGNWQEVPGIALGARDPEVAAMQSAREETAESLTQYKALINRKAEAIRAGDREAIALIDKEGKKLFGKPIPVGKAAMKGVAERQRQLGGTVQMEHAPRAIRRELKEKLSPSERKAIERRYFGGS